MALTCSAAGVAAAQAPAAASKCELNMIAALPLEFVNNRPLVEVGINGVKAKMLIDTGASRSILSAPKMRKMGNEPTPSDVSFSGVGGTRNALELTLKTFELGGGSAKNLRLFALEIDLGGEAVGILGEDLLIDSDVEFDLQAKQLRLFREKNCGKENLAYWTKEPAIADMEVVTDAFEMFTKLNGTTIHAQLDSGAVTSIVTLEAARRVGAQPKEEELDDTSSGIGTRKVAVSTVTFDRLAIGDEEIKNARLLVGDFFRAAREATTGAHIKSSSNDYTEMLLGADFLRSHRVLVAKGQHRVYFSYQGGPVFQVIAPVGATSAPAGK